MRFNNKGFTLVEVLAVIAIIAIVGLIAVPNVLSLINTGNNTSYNVLVEDIKVAAQSLFEEVEYNDSEIASITKIDDNNSSIVINLQTLLDYGFLNGTNDDNNTNKMLINPKDKKNMGNCSITIIKNVGSNYKVTYRIESNSNNSECPTTDDYSK